MTIEPIAYFQSPFPTKFGIPRQSGLVDSLTGRVVFTPPYRQAEAVRGLEGFDYVWLIWGFTNSRHPSPTTAVTATDDTAAATARLTVRPPRLGGNERVGVFASRSPFRPNGLGLSAVRLLSIAADGSLFVGGADLMDGTPVYDVKPYVPYADAHPNARGGFTDQRQWQPLTVDFSHCTTDATPQWLDTLRDVLSQDPRPHYHDEPQRIYGMVFDNCDVRFQVADHVLTVLSIIKILGKNRK